MDLKLVILILLSLGVALAGCAEEDACKPGPLTFCLDDHRMWTCAPDGNPEKGSPPYIIRIIDCRISTEGRNPYCFTFLGEENGQRGGTYCLNDPNFGSGDFNNMSDATSNDVEADAN